METRDALNDNVTIKRNVDDSLSRFTKYIFTRYSVSQRLPPLMELWSYFNHSREQTLD